MLRLVACSTLIGLSLLFHSFLSPTLAEEASPPWLEGYLKYADYAPRVQKLAETDGVTVEKIATTPGGRDVHVVTLGASAKDAPAKPAILIVGGVSPGHLVGTELPLAMAEQLAAAEAGSPAAELLEKVTIYLVPRLSPDAMEKAFVPPFQTVKGNDTPTDDDRDFSIGEDPPTDLNGDGWITQIRVANPAGKWMVHPDDDRVLIEADAKKGELGAFDLYTEGKDADGDEAIAEDVSGGVSADRNFTFKYSFFGPHTGEHQMSEPETKALADFAFGHANIFAVFTFTEHENLFHEWKPDGNAEKNRIKTTLIGDDAPYQKKFAETYREAHGGKDAPAPPKAEGDVAHWAYFHFGRWSLAARGWWIPKVEAKPEKDEEGNEIKPSGEKRGSDELNQLRWLEQEGLDGFANWTEIEHPDFANTKVEVGGMKPLFALNPPITKLEGLAAKHVEYLNSVAELLPKLEIVNTKQTDLGGGLWELEAEVINTGFLPVMSKMGDISNQVQPPVANLTVPEGTEFIQGNRREKLGRLGGSGGSQKLKWLLRLPADAALPSLKVSAPTVGSVEFSWTK